MFFDWFKKHRRGHSCREVVGMFRAVLLNISRMESHIMSQIEELQARINELIAKQDEQAAKIDTLVNVVAAENENIRRAIELIGNTGDNPAITALIQTVTAAQKRITRSTNTLTTTAAAIGEAAQTLDNTVAPDPTIASFDPTFGPGGTHVTLFGTNLGGAAVDIGGVACEIVSNSDTSIEVIISAEAQTGPFHVVTPNGEVTSEATFSVG